MGVPKQARFFPTSPKQASPSSLDGKTGKWGNLADMSLGRAFSSERRSILEKLRERIQQIKKKRPGYGEILDFYQKVKEAQDKVKASLKIDPIKLKKEWKELLAKEGFSLIQKEDFPLDIEASIKLFRVPLSDRKRCKSSYGGAGEKDQGSSLIIKK